MFYDTPDELVLSAKLMLWGGWKRIVSFEGMLNNEMQAVSSPGESKQDLKFLRELHLGLMAYGDVDSQLYRFICVTETRYTDERMLTVKDIIRELKNKENFQGQEPQSLEALIIPYPNSNRLYKDLVDIDPKNQAMFELDIDGDYEEQAKEKMARELEGYKDLQNYVLHNRLYYVTFHTKEIEDFDSSYREPIYVVTIGVSPNSGNLLGAFAVQRAPPTKLIFSVKRFWNPVRNYHFLISKLLNCRYCILCSAVLDSFVVCYALGNSNLKFGRPQIDERQYLHHEAWKRP